MKSLKPLCQSLLTQGILCVGLLLLSAPLSATFSAQAQPKALSAWETGHQFYLWALRHPGKGLPLQVQSNLL